MAFSTHIPEYMTLDIPETLDWRDEPSPASVEWIQARTTKELERAYDGAWFANVAAMYWYRAELLRRAAQTAMNELMSMG